MSADSGALTGVRVLDLTRLFPGAYCTLLLQRMGAQVTKIEAPGTGDQLRHAPPLRDGQGLMFDVLNEGKRSLAVDLKTAAGIAVLMKLAESADVLVEGNRPGVMDRLGAGYQALSRVNPKLVMCSITGYGQAGGRAQRAGHDLNYMALSGALALNGPPDRPLPYGIQVADFAAGGLAAALAIAGALLDVLRGGDGRHLDISMADGARDLVLTQLARVSGGDDAGRGREPLTGRYACYRVYECADGRHYSVAALEPRFWAALCESVGVPQLIPLQYAEGEDNELAHRVMERAFLERSRDEWRRELEGVDACAEPVLELGEVAATGWSAPAGRGPRLGEDSGRVLEEAGYAADEVRELAEAGVITLADG